MANASQVQADELLRAGDLDGARASLVDVVKRTPDDQAARMFLFQLMAVCGEWDKAVAQLRALGSLSPEAQMLASVYNQAITAEKTRLEAYAGKRPFEVLVPSSPWVEQLAQGLTAAAAGRIAEGEDLRNQAFDAAGDTPGTLVAGGDGAAEAETAANDKPFLWVADADPRLGPCFEAIVTGRWGLVPFEAVSRIKVDGPRDLRDLVWLPVEMMLRSGQSAAALLPARYPGTESAGEGDLRLSRATEWREGPNGEYPVGQRLWSFDDGSEVGVLSVSRLDMA
jgi:type VI secretion system protein ImpE